jgi:hypothetical protein
MTNSHALRAFILGSSFAVFLCIFPTGARAVTFYIDAPVSYQSGTCHPNLINRGDITGGLQARLRDKGWTGIGYNGPNAWAIDFVDYGLDRQGIDYQMADGADLAVFDGHGNVDDMAFSHPDPHGYCDAGKFDPNNTNIELGAGGGGSTKAALFIAMTCCYVDPHHYAAERLFGGNQILGLGNEADFDTNEINEFYGSTGGGNGRNWSAWLNNLEDKPGWWTGNNTPVAVTLGWNPTDANNNKSTCGLQRGTCWTRKGYNPGTFWIKDWYENGCGGCAFCGQ